MVLVPRDDTSAAEEAQVRAAEVPGLKRLRVSLATILLVAGQEPATPTSGQASAPSASPAERPSQDQRWIQAESLDAEQAPVGGEADLAQRAQIGQPFADPEVPGVVDRGLGAQRSSFLVVLLDRGVLVVDVQARGDALGDHPSAEPARCCPWPGAS